MVNVLEHSLHMYRCFLSKVPFLTVEENPQFRQIISFLFFTLVGIIISSFIKEEAFYLMAF
jgi:hypothetical protein